MDIGDSSNILYNITAQMISWRKHMEKRLRSLPLAALAALCFALILPAVSSAETLIGNWEGAVIVDSAPIGVDLKIDLLKTNMKGGVFHYGEPRACRLSVVYITIDNSVYWFAMTESSGGYCDKLDGKHIKLSLGDGSTSLEYEIIAGQSAGKRESATLQRSAGQ
jgi:hypothetical protein